MKVALNWLQSYLVDTPNWDIVFDKLTNAGIEVEGVEVDGVEEILELKITPNRGDCLSVMGLLREIAALTDYKVKDLSYDPLLINMKHNPFVEIKDINACPNYIGVIVENINRLSKSQLLLHTIACMNKCCQISFSLIYESINIEILLKEALFLHL